jgi:hydroxymethylpyrimidine kinase/phosphomethylpyrimidine kinase
LREAAGNISRRIEVEMPVAMTIAGSDCSGGAGIQADLKTFYACGVHGAAVITSVTSQNTRGVVGRYDLPAGVVSSQMEAVLSDLEVKGAKTGMLATAEIVGTVAEMIEEYDLDRLVVDPVTLSSWGQPLLDEEGLRMVAERLLPLAMVFTPNLFEASAFAGRDIGDKESMKEAARYLREMGPSYVVIKGGHLGMGDEAVDIFFDGEDMVELRGRRIRTGDAHGTGCVFSASIAAHLALGDTALQAARKAKDDIAVALMNSLNIGGGVGPVHPLPGPSFEWGTLNKGNVEGQR